MLAQPQTKYQIVPLPQTLMPPFVDTPNFFSANPYPTATTNR